MPSWFRFLLVCSALALFFGCDLTKDKTVAEQAVQAFHLQFNQGEFEQIYNASRSEFKEAAPEDKYLPFMQTVHRKLGAYQSQTETGWTTKTSPKGQILVLSYNSVFEKGGAVETFTFLIIDSSAKLMGYNIESPILLAK